MVDQLKKNAIIGVPRERTIIDPEGHYMKKLEVPYKIGDANYSVLVDKEGSTKESIQKAVTDDAQKVSGLAGTSIPI